MDGIFIYIEEKGNFYGKFHPQKGGFTDEKAIG